MRILILLLDAEREKFSKNLLAGLKSKVEQFFPNSQVTTFTQWFKHDELEDTDYTTERERSLAESVDLASGVIMVSFDLC